MNILQRKYVNRFLISLRGKIFTATFYKKDHTSRTMNCRLHVKKHLHGGTLKYNPKEKGLIPVYDLQKKWI